MKKVDQSPCKELEEGEFAPESVLISSVDDDTRARKSNNNGWSCEVCGKKFSSKKALGGHMRVHLKPPKMIENDDSEIGDRKSSTTCTLCGKKFWSLRSLCGHMRCHPERQRRGMKSGGCENPPSSSSNETELDDEDACGAACALMLIATGEERYKLSPRDKKEETMNSKKRKRNEVGWKVCRCDVCGKSFGSHQALGGHMSSAHTRVFIKSTTVSHVSKICDREFLRGQAALGGHWRGSCSSSSLPSDEDRMMGSGREETKRVVVDVDLNELAPEYGDGDLPALALMF